MFKLALIVFVFSLNLTAAEFKIAVSHFPPYVDSERSDKGDFLKYFGAFFESEGIEVKYSFVPFARSIDLVKNRSVDATIYAKVGLNHLKRRDFFVISKAFYPVKYCLIYSKKNFPTGLDYKQIEDLKKYQVISFVKSPINGFLDSNNISYKGITSIDSALKMLSSKRADVFPNAKEIIDHAIKEKTNLKLNLSCDQFIFQNDIVLVINKKSKYVNILNKLNQYIESNKLLIE